MLCARDRDYSLEVGVARSFDLLFYGERATASPFESPIHYNRTSD